MVEHQKIIFRLERDEDGYPPLDYERLWATPLSNGNYLIDSIPFFVMGISDGDEVSVNREGNNLVFEKLLKPSGASTFRLVPANPEMSAKVRADIEALGCSSEYNQHVGLIAVEVPASRSIQPFLDYIVEKREEGVLDVEEGALRHDLEDAA